jgi:hypothetical protein
MKTLKSMVEFVKQQKENNTIDLAQRFINSYEHALLLSQQPNIGMFVSAVCEDGVWRVLEYPTYTTNHSDDCYCDNCEKETKRCSLETEQYQQAQSKVIFKGWKIIEQEYKDVVEISNEKYFAQLIDNKLYIANTIGIGSTDTLEDLVKFNLEMI